MNRTEEDLLKALLNGQPYFGSAMEARQGAAIRKVYMQALVEYLVRAGHKEPLKVLEVGSWAGASAVTWAQAIRKFAAGAGKVTCVDFWKPYFDTRIDSGVTYRSMQAAAEDGSIYRLFLHNIRAAGVDDLIEHLVGDSLEVLPKLPKGSFDIVFIDGSHVYSTVASDIANAKRLVRVGGVVCGDDLELELSEVDPGVHRKAVASARDFVHEPLTGQHYHPGVTQAVAEAFDRISVWDGFWAVRRAKGRWAPIDLKDCTIEVPEHLSSDFSSFGTSEYAEAPDILCEYKGYNLIRWRDELFGLRQSLGEVDLALDPQELQARYGADNLLIGSSCEALSARIDQIEVKRQGEELGRQFAELRSDIGTALAELSDGLARHGTEIVEGQRASSTEGAARFEARWRKRFEGLKRELARLKEMPRAFAHQEEGLEALRVEAEEGLTRLDAKLGERLEVLEGAFRAGLEGISANLAEQGKELGGLRACSEEGLARLEAKLDESFEALQAHFEARVGELSSDLARQGERLHERLEALQADLGVRIKELATDHAHQGEELSGLKLQAEEGLARLEEALARRLAALEAGLGEQERRIERLRATAVFRALRAVGLLR